MLCKLLGGSVGALMVDWWLVPFVFRTEWSWYDGANPALKMYEVMSGETLSWKVPSPRPTSAESNPDSLTAGEGGPVKILKVCFCTNNNLGKNFKLVKCDSSWQIRVRGIDRNMGKGSVVSDVSDREVVFIWYTLDYKFTFHNIQESNTSFISAQIILFSFSEWEPPEMMVFRCFIS